MSTQESLSRRDLIATIAGGAALGGIWGAAFPAVAAEQRPTIAVVGEGTAQLVMIDSGSARAVVFVGEPDTDLLEQLPAMVTIFRQRIDLLVGTEPVLSAHSGDLTARWGIRHAVVLQGRTGAMSLPVESTVVATARVISLSPEMTMAVHVGHRDEWSGISPASLSVLWSMMIRTPSATIAICPDVASFAATAPGPASLLVTPNAPAHDVRAISPAEALAVNYDSASINAPEKGPEPLTRIYPRDIARFVIGREGIALPEWTVTGSTSP